MFCTQAKAFARAGRESRAMEIGRVVNLWRYPIKSLKAEPLARAEFVADGIVGDRAAALLVDTPEHARTGKPFRGKESPLLHLTADAETAASFAADANVMVSLARGPDRWFDAAPVSILLDLWVHDVEALVGEALDPLRWRPNIYVAAAPGFVQREADLVGATLHAGDLVLHVVDTIKRCVTTTYDIETGAGDPRVLGEVARLRENVVGIYAEVLTRGIVEVGEQLLME
jgi:uncharacterized protein YcbX